MKSNDFNVSIDINSLFPSLVHSENLCQDKEKWYKGFVSDYKPVPIDNTKSKKWTCYNVKDSLKIDTILDFWEYTDGISFVLNKNEILALQIVNDSIKVIATQQCKAESFFIEYSGSSYTIYLIITNNITESQIENYTFTNNTFTLSKPRYIEKFRYTKDFSNLKSLKDGVVSLDFSNPQHIEFKYKLYNSNGDLPEPYSIDNLLFKQDIIYKRIIYDYDYTPYLIYDISLTIDLLHFTHSSTVLDDYFDPSRSNDFYFSSIEKTKAFYIPSVIRKIDKTHIQDVLNIDDLGLITSKNNSNKIDNVINVSTLNCVSDEGFVYTIKDNANNNIVNAFQFNFKNYIYNINLQGLTKKNLLMQEGNTIYLLQFYLCDKNINFDTFYNESKYNFSLDNSLVPPVSVVDIKTNHIYSFLFNNFYSCFIENDFRAYRNLAVYQSMPEVFELQTLYDLPIHKHSDYSHTHDVVVIFDGELAQYYIEKEMPFMFSDKKERDEFVNRNAGYVFPSSLYPIIVYLKVSYSYIQPMAEKIPRKIIPLNRFSSDYANGYYSFDISNRSLTSTSNVATNLIYNRYISYNTLKTKLQNILKEKVTYGDLAFDNGLRLLPIPDFLPSYEFDNRKFFVSLDRVYFEDINIKGFFDPDDYFQVDVLIKGIISNENFILAFSNDAIFFLDIKNRSVRKIVEGKIQGFCFNRNKTYYINNNILYEIDENFITNLLYFLYEKDYYSMVYLKEYDYVLLIHKQGFDLYQVLNNKYFECVQDDHIKVKDNLLFKNDTSLEYVKKDKLIPFSMTFYPFSMDVFINTFINQIEISHSDASFPLIELKSIDSIKHLDPYKTELFNGIYYSNYSLASDLQNLHSIKISYNFKIMDININSIASGSHVFSVNP